MPGVHQQHNRKCKHKSLASSEIAYRRKRDKDKDKFCPFAEIYTCFWAVFTAK